MASMKLPPRQKMINMMYLVLTAMLAMNVSKEVLDAFAIMDAELVRSERAHEQRSRVEYTVFAEAARRFPDKFGAPHQRALRVQAMADSLVHHIQGMKLRAIATADGLEVDALQGRDADGRDTLRALLALKAKDDREVLTRELVGSEPATPKQGPGTAHDLRLRIAAFRDSLKAMAGARGQALASALDQLFDQGDRRDASGTWNNWESTNFYDVPLAAGVATLSKLQADIRAAENDMVKWLYRSAEMDDYRFGTLTGAVVPQSNLVMAGDSFRADVFLAAYDPENPARVLLKDGRALPVGTDGKAKLRVRADAVGEQRVEGVMHFEGPNGAVEVPYATTYQVMAPLLVASPTKMNLLYRGVDNPIELSVPGVPAERVQAGISTGRIVRSGQGWVASGMSGSTAEVFATVTLPDGSTRRVGPMRFRVKDLPPPMPIVAGKTPRDSRVRKAELMAAQGVAARLEDTDFEAPWVVKRFKLVAVRGTRVVEMESPGNTFTPQMRELIADLRPGEQVYVEGIKAQLANGSGPVRELPALGFRVVP